MGDPEGGAAPDELDRARRPEKRHGIVLEAAVGHERVEGGRERVHGRLRLPRSRQAIGQELQDDRAGEEGPGRDRALGARAHPDPGGEALIESATSVVDEPDDRPLRVGIPQTRREGDSLGASSGLADGHDRGIRRKARESEVEELAGVDGRDGPADPGKPGERGPGGVERAAHPGQHERPLTTTDQGDGRLQLVGQLATGGGGLRQAADQFGLGRDVRSKGFGVDEGRLGDGPAVASVRLIGGMGDRR